MTITATRFPSHEAAQGARRAKLAEIDLFYSRVRDDIEAEHDHNWAEAVGDFWARVRVITERVSVDADGVLHGPDLLVYLATRRLDDQLDALWVRKIRLAHVRDMCLEDIRGPWDAEREPFDFDLSPTADAPIELNKEN